MLAAASAIANAMGGLGAAFKAFGSAMMPFTLLGVVLLGLGVIAVGVSVKFAQMAGNFQQSITKLYTTAGELHGNLQMVGDGILAMAGQVGTGAQQLANAMYYVESGGFHGAAGLEVLRVAAMGAKAENADLNGVAKALVFTMNAYRSVHMSAATAMNTLIASTAHGVMTLQELSTSVANVLPATSHFGISLIDVGAAMATMTAQGDPAANAATHLRQMILALEAPSKLGAASLKEVGLTSQMVGDEMKKSLPGALQMIVDAVGKKFPEGSDAYNQAIKNIAGGTRQMMGFLELTGAHMGTFALNVAQITDAVNKGGKSILGWSDVQKTLNFQVDAAKAGFQSLAIILGQRLIPVFTSIVAAVVPMITAFTIWIINSHAVENAVTFLEAAFANLVSFGASVVHFFQTNELAMDGLKGVLAGIAVAVGVGLVMAFYAAATAAWALAAGVIAATWPFLLIIGIVALLVAAFLHFYTVSAAFRTEVAAIVVGLTAFWNACVRVGSAFVTWLIAVIPVVVTWLISFWNGCVKVGAVIGSVLVPVLQQIGQFIANNFVPVWQQLVAIWQSQLLPSLKQLWSALLPLMPLLELIGGVIIGVVILALGILVAVLYAVIKGLAGFLSGLIIVIAGVVQVFTGVMQVIGGVVGFITDLITGHFDKLSADLGMIWQGIINIFVGAWRAIAGVFQTAWFTITGILTGFVTGIINFFTSLSVALVGHSIVPDMCNAIITWFTNLGARSLAIVLSFIANMIGRFNQLKSQAVSVVLSMVSAIAGALSQLWAIGSNAGHAIINGLVGAIQAGIGWVGSVVQSVAQTIANFLPHSPAKEGPLRDLNKYGPALIKGITNGISMGLPQIKVAANSIAAPFSSLKTLSSSGSVSSSASGSQQTTITLQIDGRDLAKALGPGLTKELLIQLNGGR